MRMFDYNNTPDKLLTPEMVQMIARIHEYKGRQDLLIKSCRGALDTIDVKEESGFDEFDEDSDALRRNEYNELYYLINQNYDIIQPTPKDILQFHRKLYSSSGRSFGGHYREAFNRDEEIYPERTIGRGLVRSEDKRRFKKKQTYSVRASQVGEHLEMLCAEFNDAWEDGQYDKLVLIPMFIIDFINIHAFDNGNEKISRLMAHLLLLKAGYPVGKYVDLDALIDKSIMTYFNVLESSSENWNESNNDYTTFAAYFLGILVRAYNKFEHRVHKIIEDRKKAESVISGSAMSAAAAGGTAAAMGAIGSAGDSVISGAAAATGMAAGALASGAADAEALQGSTAGSAAVIQEEIVEERPIPVIKKVHKLSKPEQIKQVIDVANEKITKKDIMATCPDISKVTVERTLTDLVKKGYIVKVGAGPSTGYIKV